MNLPQQREKQNQANKQKPTSYLTQKQKKQQMKILHINYTGKKASYPAQLLFLFFIICIKYLAGNSWSNFTVHFPIHGNLIYLRLRWCWPTLGGRSFALKTQIKLCCTSAILFSSEIHCRFILYFSCLNNRIISGVSDLQFHSPKTLELSIQMGIVQLADVLIMFIFICSISLDLQTGK